MFILVTLLAFALRIYLITRDSTPFAYDMGRDLLWTKDIAFYHIPTLIGPAASIWGVYFQPFWYYFLSIPLLLANGHPLSAVYATSITVILTGLLSLLLFKKYLTKAYAFTFMVIILFSSNLVNISTFAFHANVLPLLSILATYFMYLAVIKNSLYLAASYFFISLMFSADPAPAVVLTPIPVIVFFYFKLHKSAGIIKTITLSLGAYFLPFAPQILFELRNNFVEIRSLIAYFQGENPSLSGQLPILERIPNRLSIYFDFFKSSFAPYDFIAIAFLALIIFGCMRFIKLNKNPKLAILFKINLITLGITFLINTLIISVEIKTWYLYGITVNIAMMIVFALLGAKSKTTPILLVMVFVLINLLPFAQKDRIAKSKSDPAQLANQLEVIDLIYKDAESPFSVYIYTPSIYDLNYQYLFWWQGVKLAKGLPQDFAYLPQKPAYVRNKSQYSAYTQTSETIYLVIENAIENEFYTSRDWQTNFNDYKIVWEKNINEALRLQKRTK